MKPFDLLVIGGSGFVGARLVKAAVQEGRRVAYTYGRHAVDLPASAYHVSLFDHHVLEACIAEVQPHNIVYCAVPHPGSDIEEHKVVSIDGIRRVVKVLGSGQACRLVYVSTNAVFSGKNGPYSEDVEPDPEAVQELYRTYAITRAEGESIVLAGWPDAIVARTADVNGRDVNGKLNPRVTAIVDQLLARKAFLRLKNAFITPTLVDNLVSCLLEISSSDFPYRGILHLAGSQQISYYDFAKLIARQIQADEALIQPDFSRSWNIGLNTAQTQRILSTRLLGLEELVKAFIA